MITLSSAAHKRISALHFSFLQDPYDFISEDKAVAHLVDSRYKALKMSTLFQTVIV